MRHSSFVAGAGDWTGAGREEDGASLPVRCPNSHVTGNATFVGATSRRYGDEALSVYRPRRCLSTALVSALDYPAALAAASFSALAARALASAALRLASTSICDGLARPTRLRLG